MASGSARWASKPADTSTSCGSQARISGATTCSTSDPCTASPDPPGTGRLTVKPSPSPDPASSARPGPGIERPLVDRAEQHGRVGVEDVVRPVAVVHVPVEDQHPLDPVRRPRVGRRDRHVVEEAEAHRARRRRRDGRAGAGPTRRTARRPRAARRSGRRRRRRPAAPPRRCPATAAVSMSIAPPPRADSASISSTCPCGCTRVSCSSVARGASTRSQPNQSWRAISASSATIRSGRSGWPGMACARPASWRNQGGGGTTGTVPAVQEPPSDLVVVGAGAAGLFASLTAARRGARVTLVSARGRSPRRPPTGRRAGSRPRSPRTTRRPSTSRTRVRAGPRPRSAARPPRSCARRRPRASPTSRRSASASTPTATATSRSASRAGHGIRRVVHAGGSATGRRILRQLSADVVEEERIDVLEGRRVRALLDRRRRPRRRRRVRRRPHGRRARRGPRLRAAPRRCGRAPRTRRAPTARACCWRAPRAPSWPTSSSRSSIRPPSSGSPGREGFLVSEAVRGEGATLHDAAGERFVDELQPRDAVARAIHRLLAETGEPAVFLDMTAIDPARFPNVVAALREAGHDPATRADPGLPREPLRDGRDHERPRRPQHGRRPLRRRGVRLHRPARREPARVQLAVGVLRVRPPGRARRARRARARRPRPRRRTPSLAPPPSRATRAAMWRDAGLERTADGLRRLLDGRAPARPPRGRLGARPRGEPRRARARRLPRHRSRRWTAATASSRRAPRRPRSSSGRERSALNVNST